MFLRQKPIIKNGGCMTDTDLWPWRSTCVHSEGTVRAAPRGWPRPHCGTPPRHFLLPWFLSTKSLFKSSNPSMFGKISQHLHMQKITLYTTNFTFLSPISVIFISKSVMCHLYMNTICTLVHILKLTDDLARKRKCSNATRDRLKS